MFSPMFTNRSTLFTKSLIPKDYPLQLQQIL